MSQALPAQEYFACLPDCGLCCSYRVLVTDVDRRRLQTAGGNSEPWELVSGSELALRRQFGFCMFLDTQRRFSVYEHRPDHCRAYPYLWTTCHELELDVDLSCPGLGHGKAVAVEGREPVTERSGEQDTWREAIQQVQEWLRAQGRFATPEMIHALGERCLDELEAGWPVHSCRVSQAGSARTNVETESDALAFWQGLDRHQTPAGEWLADRGWLGQHFEHPRWNTRLGSELEVAVYRFQVSEAAFRQADRDGTRRQVALGELGELPWTREAIATRRAYLGRWLERQLPIRLANNLAVAGWALGQHVATAFLQFLTEIDQRLAVLGLVLARIGGVSEIDRTTALEAIRGSDGPLRAWCESARVGLAD